MFILAKDLIDFHDTCEGNGLNPESNTQITTPQEVASLPPGTQVYVTDGAGERDNYMEIVKALKQYAILPCAAKMNPDAKALHLEVQERLAQVQLDLAYQVLENPTEGKLSDVFMECASYLNENGGIDVRSRVLLVPNSTHSDTKVITKLH